LLTPLNETPAAYVRWMREKFVIVLPMTEVFPGVSSVMFPDAMLMAAPPQPKTVFLRQERHCVLKFAFLMSCASRACLGK
jgi:hypothetical protein